MGINKVTYGSDVLVDLTSDTVTPNTLLSGVTAHDNSGTRITGTLDVATAVNRAKTLRKDVASFSSLPQTISDSRITATMEVTNIYFGTPSAITSAINWVTSAGSVTISGSISGSTTAVLYLEEGMQ